MRYDKGHKDATRQRIIDVASRQFRENGVAAVGLAGIMSDAGLTNGAFYAHFESKEDLRPRRCSPTRRPPRERLADSSESGAGLESTIRDYLSARHRDNPGGGCPTAALVAEIARHPRADAGCIHGQGRRRRCTDRGAAAAGKRQPSGGGKAIAIYGMMVGTLQLARAVNDRKLSDEILESGADQAVALSGQGSDEQGGAGEAAPVTSTSKR